MQQQRRNSESEKEQLANGLLSGFDEHMAVLAAILSEAEIWAADTCITGD
jgi:hypothetical protein